MTSKTTVKWGIEARDHLSLVIFDSDVDVLLAGCAMDRTGRREALAAIAGIQTRGATNLSAGWFQALAVGPLQFERRMSVRHFSALRHSHGWNTFSDAEVRAINRRCSIPLAFV